MAFNLIVLSPAEDDITGAIDWYEEQLEGLGNEFIGELDLTFAQITRSPKLYSKRYKQFRSVMLGRFPYKVWYLIEEDMVIVFAIVHGKRHPDYWKKML